MNHTKLRTFVCITLSNQIKSNQITLFIYGYVIRKMLFTKYFLPSESGKTSIKSSLQASSPTWGLIVSVAESVRGANLERIRVPLPQSSRRSLRSSLAPNISRTETVACTPIKRSSVLLISFHFSAHTSIYHVEHNEQYRKKTLLISSHLCGGSILAITTLGRPPEQNTFKQAYPRGRSRIKLK